MKNSKYIDVPAAVQVIGNIYNNPDLLDNTDKYNFTEDDFPNNFLKIVFGSIYNIYQLGAKAISIPAIENYLAGRPKAAAEFKTNKGAEFILECAENADYNTFPFYYSRLKKMTLFRAYESLGMDLTWLYNPDEIFDVKKKQEQEDWLDNHTVGEINDKINDRIDEIKSQYVDETNNQVCSIGEGVFELLDELKENPDLGYPMFGPYMNTITRGARFSKFYLRSAPSNVGKTRAMIADACYISCSQMYDLKNNKWITIGACQPTLLITTEQSLQEVQQMCLAFLSGVNENHIALNEYYSGEEERVRKAAQLLVQSKLHFVEIPDFSLQDIENTIKTNIRTNDVKFIFFDYLHTSMGILAEITRRAGGVKLREDNILFMLAVKLKDIATMYDVFMMSSTQLNGDWKTAEVLDMNCLRGAKAIADKIDIGFIMVETTKDDIEKLKPFLSKNGLPTPNIKMAIYKNRANEHKNEYMFMLADKGICRYETLFITDFNYNIIDVPDLKISVAEESIF